jgi:hypothetical protein
MPYCVDIDTKNTYLVDRRSVGVFEVQLGQLVSALAPSPQHCLAELHTLLPCLAATAYNTFINRVRSYR